MTSAEKSQLTHTIESRTLSGIVKSYFQPFTLERKIMFRSIMTRPERYLDAEIILQALKDYIRNATGKAIRFTRPTRAVLLAMFARRHQYQKSRIFVFPSVLAGKKNQGPTEHLRTLLERSGLIRQVKGEWAYNPYDRKRNKAPWYELSPELIELLEAMFLSVKQGRDSGDFLLVDRLTTIFDYLQTTKNPTTGSSNNSCKHANSLYQWEGFKNQRVARIKYAARKKRQRELKKLWGGLNFREMKESGQADRCRLTCHSIPVGPECDDLAVTLACEDKYHADAFANVVQHNDSILPLYVKDPVTGTPVSTHTSWRFNISRDRNGNITKIGCRPYSGLCGTLNEDHSPDEFNKRPRRKPIMEALHLEHRFDVHCSIYNIIAALSTGKFENRDIYQAIATRLNLPRPVVKKCLMKANFGIFAQQCDWYPNSERAASRMSYVNDQGKSVRLDLTYKDFQDALRAEHIRIQGKSTEIFWHEAFIYELVRKYLLDEKNIESARVYDSFYTRCYVSEEEFARLINRAVTEYLHII